MDDHFHWDLYHLLRTWTVASKNTHTKKQTNKKPVPFSFLLLETCKQQITFFPQKGTKWGNGANTCHLLAWFNQIHSWSLNRLKRTNIFAELVIFMQCTCFFSHPYMCSRICEWIKTIWKHLSSLYRFCFPVNQDQTCVHCFKIKKLLNFPVRVHSDSF